MDKAIGFRRNIYLEWADAAAAYAAAGDDGAALRAHLDPIVAHKVASAQNRAVALTILAAIWLDSRESHPALQAEALRLFAAAEPADRRWLHYGLALAAYPFFQQVVRVIGRQAQTKDSFTSGEIVGAMAAERGQLGGLEKAVQRVIFSLCDWGLLCAVGTAGSGKRVLAAPAPRLATADVDLQAWLLAAVLTAHSNEELPYLDLIRLPELFPFAISIRLDEVRRQGWFAVQRQGAGLDMVRMRE